jgi:hypothetical protein
MSTEFDPRLKKVIKGYGGGPLRLHGSASGGVAPTRHACASGSWLLTA